MLRNVTSGWIFAVAILSPALWGAVPQAQAAAPRFEAGPCPFRGDRAANYRVDCGTVAVPENRAAPEGRKVRLHVAIVRASDLQPRPDPVVFLDGGPGLRSLDVLPLRMQVNLSVARLHQSRDVIFWDQRGTGYSEPHLCTTLDVSKDIRQALGIAQWNLMGASYGTRLALVYLRQSPGSVRAALLDGIYPPDVPETFAEATRMARVVELLGRRCAEDARCNARFPRIAERTAFSCWEWRALSMR